MPKTIARKSGLGWNKGNTVLLLDDPDGTTWIMNGFQLGLQSQRSYDEFLTPGQSQFKHLPPGWKVRVKSTRQELRRAPRRRRRNDHAR